MKPIRTGKLRVERLTIPFAKLPQRLHGLKIVQLSDLHYTNGQLSDRLLNQAIDIVNRNAPDIIVLTGDFIHDVPEPIDTLIPFLKRLHARHGIYAILGNHDIYFPKARHYVTRALARIGICVLWNQVVYPAGDGLALVGLADLWSGEFDPAPIFRDLDPDVPRIVLSHNPDTAETLRRWRCDLILSGHTHGGQLVLPFLGPLPKYLDFFRWIIPKPLYPYLPLLGKGNYVTQHWEWASGMFRLGRNRLYVNRGLGSYFPGRFGCPPEVTEFVAIAQPNAPQYGFD